MILGAGAVTGKMGADDNAEEVWGAAKENWRASVEVVEAAARVWRAAEVDWRAADEVVRSVVDIWGVVEDDCEE